MIHRSQTVSPVDDKNASSSRDDRMSGEEDDDGRSLEEPLADGSVSDPSDGERWLEEFGGDGDKEYSGGEEVIHPVPAPPAEERQARRRGARAIARPVRMTNAELELHRIQGHTIYHPGCEHCVRSRALADKHLRVSHDDGDDSDNPDKPPVISADFCFPDDEGSKGPLTVS